MITNEYDIARIAIDAGIAIDALEAIVNVTREQGQIHERYLSEKIRTVKNCTEAMESFCEVEE